MQIVIIEDEQLTATDLADTILKVDPGNRVVEILYSVKEAVRYFQKNEPPDLIFSDIQLGDGLSFEIFTTVAISTPVIFCTAFDEYALNAFKANGIDYILKPFNKNTIADALTRYEALKSNLLRNSSGYGLLADLFGNRKNQEDASVLIHVKDKIIPIKISDIALFYTQNETTFLVGFNLQKFSIHKTLDDLERITGHSFYRANRQYLINRKAVKEATQWFHRKLVVNLVIPFTTEEPITISKVKVTGFLNWLSGI